MAEIAFTYDPLTTIGLVRLLSGDTDEQGITRSGGSRTRTDSEIEALLLQGVNDPYLTAALLLEGRGAEYVQEAIHTTQGALSQDMRQRSKLCFDAAKSIRQKGGQPIKVLGSDPVFVGAAGTEVGNMVGW